MEGGFGTSEFQEEPSAEMEGNLMSTGDFKSIKNAACMLQWARV